MSKIDDVTQKFYDMVPILEDSDFDKDNKLIFNNLAKFTGKPIDTAVVMIYADWCPHCVHTKPAMVEAVQKLESTPNVLVVAIPLAGDDVDEKLKGRLQSIAPSWSGGIPFIGKIKGGSVQEHKGNRKADDIVKFVMN